MSDSKPDGNPTNKPKCNKTKRLLSSDSKTKKNTNPKGGGRPKVEARVSVEELRKAFRKQMSLPGSSDANQDTQLLDPMEKCREMLGKPRGKTGVILDPRMAEPHCLWDPEYPECPARYTSVLQRCTEMGLLSRCHHLTPRSIKDEELAKMHTPELISLLRSTEDETDTDKLEDISANYNSIYLHPKSNKMAELAAGSTIEMVDAVVKGTVYNGMAIVRPPGHHAMRSQFCGYCYYNNVALAARHAIDNLGLTRILIVDWDVHHGQATQQMFYDDDRVLYFSVHRYQQGSYWPQLRESNYDYTGSGAGKGYNCNVPLNETGLGNAEYLAIWTQLLLPLAYQFSPELVLVSAGYDAALGCFEGLMRITPAFYCQLTSLLMPLAAGKMVVALEGGYCLESLAEGAALTLRTLLGDPPPNILDPLDSSPNQSLCESILNVISVLRGRWQGLQFQGSYGTEHAPTDRTTRNARPKHVPRIEFLGPDQPPTRYDTRGGYALLTPEQQEETGSELARLKAGTVLTVPCNSVCYVYDKIMEAHHCQSESSHPERPARTREVMKLLQQRGLLDRMKLLPSRTATIEQLSSVHSPELVSLMGSTATTTDRDRLALEDRYTSVYLNSDTYTAATTAAGSLIQVVESVVSGESARGVAVIRPPGHHAEHDEPNGFCIFNNVAVAARHAIDSLGLQRVLILDWDIHHGNGIQHAFESDPRVLYVSLHLYKNATFFPHSTDANYDKLGEGDGLGYNINVPWQKGGVGDAEYIAAFTQLVLPVAYQFAPQLVLVSAGFDAAINDPVGGCEVSPECYGHLTRLLAGLASGRLVLALEGGYNLVSTSHSLSMCVSALLGDALPPLRRPLLPAPHAVATLNSVLLAAAPHWPLLTPFRVDLPAASSDGQARKKGKRSSSAEGGKGEARADISDSSCVTDQLSLKMANLNVGDSSDGSAGGSSDAPSSLSLGASAGASGGSQHSGPATSSGAAGPSTSSSAAGPSTSSSAAGPSTSSGATGGGGSAAAAAVVSEEQLLVALATAPEDQDASTTIAQLLQMQQDSGFMVEPAAWCPHLEEGVGPVPDGGLSVTAPCYECGSEAENWCCLSCYKVGCGRFVSGHLLDHGTVNQHPLALSFSDFSVWCYTCQQYVHNKALLAAKQSAYLSKFGEQMPVPESWQD